MHATIIARELRRLATPDQLLTLDLVREQGLRDNVPVAVVGGGPRDALLGAELADLDFVVEGDAIHFAQALREQHGGALTLHPKFRTGTWHWRGQSLDIVTARTERYARPAALPEITPSRLEDDLKRRDVTINAIALRLNDETLIDPFDGVGDLARRVVRALHAQSFVDDPTRIFRVSRYAARLAFEVDAQTREWLRAGLPHVRSLSGERVKYDLELIFDDRDPSVALGMLHEWGVFHTFGIPVPDRDLLHARFVAAQDRLVSGAWPLAAMELPYGELGPALGWSALTYNLGQLAVARWIEWLPLDARLRDALVQLGALGSIDRELFQGRASAQSRLLRDFEDLALLMAWLHERDPRKSGAILAEYREWRNVRATTTGAQLTAMGLRPGPEYGRILGRLRDAWLDGDVTTQGQEAALLATLVPGRM